MDIEQKRIILALKWFLIWIILPGWLSLLHKPQSCQISTSLNSLALPWTTLGWANWPSKSLLGPNFWDFLKKGCQNISLSGKEHQRLSGSCLLFYRRKMYTLDQCLYLLDAEYVLLEGSWWKDYSGDHSFAYLSLIWLK